MNPVLPLLAALSDLTDLQFLRSNPWLLLVLAFQLWMLVDALRRGEYLWAVFIFLFPGLNAVIYYFLVYRSSAPVTRGFELPGAHDRRRIKQLEAQIHHLDKAHHYTELGNIHFQRGKLTKAETCYRSALQRDPTDIDARAHLGQCLSRQRKPEEALPLLERVCAESPRHDYGHSQMALAEVLTALGKTEAAVATWQRVLEEHSYARARVQLAELYLAAGKPGLAKAQLEETISDDVHAPAFQRKRDRIWIRKAKRLLRKAR